MEAISNNHTWTLVKLPQGHKPISIKLNFKIKEDQHKHTRYKGCLMAQGCKQKTKIGYKDMFSLVAKWTTIKLVTSIAMIR
jgi:hypothetical protein